jgi:uncharacterized protein
MLAVVASASQWKTVEDLARVLTWEEWDELLERADAISVKHRCDVVLVTLDKMTDNDGAYEWARYIYEQYDYGYGADRSGIIFFLSIAERDFALVAYGYGNTAFTDYGKDVMLDDYILPLLKDDRYFEAFSVYLDKADEFLTMARDGNPFDVDYSESVFLIKLAAVILLPLLIAFIFCTRWKNQMKSAVAARTACNYIPAGGFNLTGQADTFLYRTQSRTKIERQSSSSRGGTTTDSRGYSGRSGKF